MTESREITTIPRIGDTAPDFTAVTTQGELTASEYQGGDWLIMFSHPADFTPVCSTELTEFARRQEEFTKQGCKLMGISIDSIHAHLAWRENLADKMGVTINYPMIADNGRVAGLYGMLHPGESQTATVRAVFFIDPKRTVRALMYYPLNVGRNVDEVVRTLVALKTADTNAVACPVNWQPGDKVIVPPPKTDKEVSDRKEAGHEMIDFYLCKKSL